MQAIKTKSNLLLRFAVTAKVPLCIVAPACNRLMSTSFKQSMVLNQSSYQQSGSYQAGASDLDYSQSSTPSQRPKKTQV